VTLPGMESSAWRRMETKRMVEDLRHYIDSHPGDTASLIVKYIDEVIIPVLATRDDDETRESLVQQLLEKDKIIEELESIIEKNHRTIDTLQEENRDLRSGTVITKHISDPRQYGD